MKVNRTVQLFALAIVMFVTTIAPCQQEDEIEGIPTDPEAAEIEVEPGRAGRAETPMIISLSWSSPDTRYLKLHLDEWEELPFTGVALTAAYPQTEAGNIEACTYGDLLTWKPFNMNTRFTPEMFEGPTKDLKATNFNKDKDDSLLTVISWANGRCDWYDDDWWSDVLNNIGLLAKLAKEGGLKGILLDLEEYAGSAFWSWGGSRPNFALKNFEPYKDKTWKQTRARVRKCGREFMQAINAEYPGCLIWYLYAYSHTELKGDLSDSGNGLLAAFVDGMLEAGDDETVFVDGCEGSYWPTRPDKSFAELRTRTLETALKYTEVPEIYSKKMRIGFAVYFDQNANPDNWNPENPEINALPPKNFEEYLKRAFEIGDGYVWIYSEYPSWWLRGPEDTFGDGVNSRDDHEWIPPIYHEIMARVVYSQPGLSKPVKVEPGRSGGAEE